MLLGELRGDPSVSRDQISPELVVRESSGPA